jgi:glycerophosphoryl diester phosphodiesterase
MTARGQGRRLPDAFRRRADRPAIVGHRGARGEATENTIAAFEAAGRQGADAVELDVRPCKSGQLVVFHDPDLWRVAGDHRTVEEVTLAELRELARADVPTLEDALDAARAASLGVNVEVKRDVVDRRALVDRVARVLNGWEPSHDIVVSFFDPWMLRDHHARCPGRCHALLVHRSAYEELAFFLARRIGAEGVHLHATLVRDDIVPRIAARGFVAAWTINDVVVARRAFDLGADALITDEPGRMLASFTT